MQIECVSDSTSAIVRPKRYQIYYLFSTAEIEAVSYEAAFAWHEANHPTWDLQGVHEIGDNMRFV